MTKFILTITTLLIGLMTTAQVSENRPATDFSKLKVAQGIEVFYTVSNVNSIKVETDDQERLQMIKTEIEGETLKIFVDTENTKKSKSKQKNNMTIDGVSFNSIKVYVSGKSLTDIKASSSADIKIQNLNTSDKLDITSSSSASISGSFECSDFRADVSSSGEVNANVNGKSIAVEVSSSGEITLKGRATSLELKASSSGSANLKGLTVENASVKASSSSDVTLTVTKLLNASATSSAEIFYYGNPTEVETEKSSSGSVSKRL